MRTEVDVGSESDLRAATGESWEHIQVFDDGDRGAAPASGSAPSAGMVICPCSMGTVSAIAQGNSRSLVERAADVALKEGRPLLIVPRETPLSPIQLRNLVTLTEAGATVIPASPGFYHQPAQIADLIDFVVQRVLDHMRVEAALVPRWQGEA